MSSRISSIVEDLQTELEQLEQAKAPSITVDTDSISELEQLENAAADGSYRLSFDEMAKVAGLSSVFAQQLAEMSPEEQEAMLQQARKDRDKVTLFLLSKHSPSAEVQALARSMGTDEATLKQVAVARSLYARVRHLRSLSPVARQELARSLGHTVKEAQQEDSRTEQDHYNALISSGSYSL